MSPPLHTCHGSSTPNGASAVADSQCLCSNAFIVPTVYFFYPETANRSLEEMDIIFRKSKSIFDTVGIAKREPRRYGKHGELLLKTEQIEDNRLRNASVVSANAGKVSEKWDEGGSDEKKEM